MTHIIADSHPPKAMYDAAFIDAEKTPTLTKDDSIVYVAFHLLPHAITWLGTQDYTASLMLMNGDAGLDENDFCYYFNSGHNLTNFMFWDDLLPPNLNYIYVQNLNVEHDRLRHLPLGILSKHAKILDEVRLSAPPIKKDKLLYVNFDTTTYMFRSILTRGYFADVDWATVEAGLSLPEYYRQVQSTAFVACPRGNGHDSFRVWESLLLGAFPVVTRTVGMQRLSAFLPILVVDKWSDVTEERLQRKLTQFQHKGNRWPEMLTQEFWTEHVQKQRMLSQQTLEVRTDDEL